MLSQIKINPLSTNIKYKFTHKFTHKFYWIEKLKELINFRHLAGVLEGVFVLKLKAKCEPSTVSKKRENLRAKTQVSEIFQITFHFKDRTEESIILLVQIKKTWCQICKKINWLISDHLFSCVFSMFLPMKWCLYDSEKKKKLRANKVMNEKNARVFSKTLLKVHALCGRSFLN